MDRHPIAAAAALILYGLPVATLAAIPDLVLPIDGDELTVLRAEAAGVL